MKHLKTHHHPDLKDLDPSSVYTRLATRAIAMQGTHILLMYTARYEDYSLPGGGLEAGEDHIIGMMRELREETGAQNIRNVQPYGIYEEYRPWYKPDYDIQHMISYCYTCDINTDLGDASLEDYETKNGMTAVWIDIHKAIAHNKNMMASSNKKGMSIERETYLLEHIAQHLSPVKSH